MIHSDYLNIPDNITYSDDEPDLVSLPGDDDPVDETGNSAIDQPLV